MTLTLKHKYGIFLKKRCKIGLSQSYWGHSKLKTTRLFIVRFVNHELRLQFSKTRLNKSKCRSTIFKLTPFHLVGLINLKRDVIIKQKCLT